MTISDEQIQALISKGLLTDCAGNARYASLLDAYRQLLARPESAEIAKNPPRLLMRKDSSLGDAMNAGAGGNMIVFGHLTFKWCSLPEQKAILAHELAHRILGHSGGSTPEKERQADRLTAQLLDYQIEPLISALSSIEREGKALMQELRTRLDEELLDDDGKLVREARSPSKPSWIERIGMAIIQKLHRPTHPKADERAAYLRALAAEHGVYPQPANDITRS